MALGIIWATSLLGVFLAILALDMLGFLSRKNHFDVDGQTVLLTGGSQGMGQSLAKLLAQKGANVVVVARTQSKLDETVQYVQTFAKYPGKQRFLAISADVTKTEENIRLVREVTAWNDGRAPDIVWANAGQAHPGLFVDTDLEILRSQMEINYWAAAYLAQATLKAWLKPATTKSTSSPTRPRHLIMTSTVACLVPLAGYSPYSPPKAAMRCLSDTLRSEVNLYNGHRKANPELGPTADIQIHCVLPGTILSPGFENEYKLKHPVTKILEESDPKQTADEVAIASIKGLERGDYLVTTQFLGYALRVGMMGGSPRNGWGILDTIVSWIVSPVWLFAGPDMENKVWKYGKQNKLDLQS